MIAQPRGALRVGGTNKGGPGRPPSAIREVMRCSSDERLRIAEEIADNAANEPSERMQALDFLAPFGLGTHDDQVDTGSYLAAYVLAGTASRMTARVSF